tara:strand:+ start:8814 stop:9566 length:753 start_codon:yes stop_codon:yes gene_type:complete
MNIGIIGFGRFGQVMAKILKPNHNIITANRSDKSKIAKKLGIKYSDLNKVCKQELIILAVPIREIGNLIQKIQPMLKPGTILMDTCSVKEYPIKIMKKYLPADIEILGTHPMFGPDSIKYGLRKLQIVFCPANIQKENLEKIKAIFKNLALQIIQVSAKEHDKQTALSLCLVHFIGRGLGKMKTKLEPIHTLNFNRLLKIQESVTNDSLELFQDMQKYNKYAKEQRKSLINALQNIDKKLLSDKLKSNAK